MKKVVRNGLIAVILGASYKSAWFTNHKVEELLYDPHVIDFIEAANDFTESLVPAYELEEYCDAAYGYRDYYGDVTDLKIEWVSEKTSFIVKDIYGWETIILTDY